MLFDLEPLAGLTGGNVNFTVIPIQIYFGRLNPNMRALHGCCSQHHSDRLLAAMNSVAIILQSISVGG